MTVIFNFHELFEAHMRIIAILVELNVYENYSKCCCMGIHYYKFVQSPCLAVLIKCVTAT